MEHFKFRFIILNWNSWNITPLKHCLLLRVIHIGNNKHAINDKFPSFLSNTKSSTATFGIKILPTYTKIISVPYEFIYNVPNWNFCNAKSSRCLRPTCNLLIEEASSFITEFKYHRRSIALNLFYSDFKLVSTNN